MEPIDYEPPPPSAGRRRTIAVVVAAAFAGLMIAALAAGWATERQRRLYLRAAAAAISAPRARTLAAQAATTRAAATAPGVQRLPRPGTDARGRVRPHPRQRPQPRTARPPIASRPVYVTGVGTPRTVAVPRPGRPTVLRYGESADLVSDPLPAGFVPAAAWVEFRTAADASRAAGIDVPTSTR